MSKFILKKVEGYDFYRLETDTFKGYIGKLAAEEMLQNFKDYFKDNPFEKLREELKNPTDHQ